MRIIHLSTSVSDSSAVVRQHIALLKLGIDSNIYTLNDATSGNVINIHVIKPRARERIANKIIGIFEKLISRFRSSKFRNMPYSFSLKNISILKYLETSDIVHFHWTSGFVSNSQYRKILMKYKTVVSFHDSCFLTGGCHVKLSCEKYKDGCHSCPYFVWLRHPEKIIKKKRIPEKAKVILVSPSKWMQENVEKSYATKGVSNFVVPNTLDTSIFKKRNDLDSLKKELKNNYIILFGAINGVNIPYKGFEYLIKALRKLNDNKSISEEITLMIFGSDRVEPEVKMIGFNVLCLGQIDSMVQLAQVYSVADVYVVPSLEDSFNQTVVESLCCETPVVAFKTGGIIENIEHKITGYLADYGDCNSLAQGIEWVYFNNVENNLGIRGRAKMIQKCNENKVGKQLIEIYQKFKVMD